MAGVRTCVYEGWLSSDPNPSQVPAGFWSARSRPVEECHGPCLLPLSGEPPPNAFGEMFDVARVP
jgi:hypothetical protein